MKLLPLFALTVLVSLTACSGAGDLGRGRTGQTMTVTGHSYDRVWDASIRAMQTATGDQALEVDKNLMITKQDKTAGVINASTGMSLWSWGEVVGVYITPAHNASQYTIEVESLTKMKTNVFAHNWEEEIMRNIKTNLQ